MMLLALMLVLTAVALPVSAEEGHSPMYVGIDGPLASSTGETYMYVVTCLGGPGEGNGTYSMEASLIGPDVYTGTISPSKDTSRDGVFYINVTMPTVEQRLGIKVDVSSSGDAGEYETMERVLYLNVYTPIVITATVFNSGLIDAVGVPVTIYNGDAQIYNTTVDVGSDDSALVTYNWIVQDLGSGAYSITVKIDPDNEFVKFDNGGTAITTTVYKGQTSYDLTNGLLLLLLVLLGITFVLIYRRPVKKKKKGKKGKKRKRR